MNHAALLTRFYSAFQQKDADAMVACYAPDVRFSDPVFPDLVSERARGMWRMLVGRGKDLRLEFSGIEADDRQGRAHWEAWYTFTATGRKVHNVIDDTFTFRDGLIATHTDRFDLYRWTRHALGTKGTLLGWTPFVQQAIRRQADTALTRFLTERTRSTDA